MTAPQGAGGPDAAWLDMSRYPDTDPDTVLSGDEQGLLTSALAVDDGALPDAVWEHMLAVVTGEAGEDPAVDDPAADDPADTDDPAAWSAEPALDEHGHDDPGAPDTHGGYEAHGDWDATDPAWDGGAV
ncbi:hypothetical protein [Actinomycetospora straminea]|uniref:Uncharacterized protein n=1 Tax=Actinomycetospora straminea TaxID=663607 RepID=A0ABP9EL35_9PSEU|nr:hypothetical protein [Actinomycetospora straminea]MDD7935049.1 hypothetical protein [Actinomycetospora straminea]